MRTESIKEAGKAGASTHGQLEELEATIRRWARFHAFDLMAAFIHALELPVDIRRAETHLLRICIKRWEADNPLSKQWKTSFKIDVLAVLEQSQARLLGPEWNDGLDKLTVIRLQNEQAGRGTVGVITIECEPLSVYFIPVGSLKDLGSVRVLHGYWRLMLMAAMADDKKFVSLESRLVSR